MDEECAGNPFNDGHCREIQPQLGCRAPLRQGALEALFEDVNAQDPGIITVTSDMNAANLAVVKKVLPKTEIVFKQFHVIQHLSADGSRKLAKSWPGR